MSTNFTEVEKSFYSRFQDRTILDPGLVMQFFQNALSEFEVELSPLEFNDEQMAFQDKLSRPEVSLLGMLMYRSYLGRELDRMLKLSNIVGRDLSLTGTGQGKKALQDRYDSLSKEISTLSSKLKDGSYYE